MHVCVYIGCSDIEEESTSEMRQKIVKVVSRAKALSEGENSEQGRGDEARDRNLDREASVTAARARRARSGLSSSGGSRVGLVGSAGASSRGGVGSKSLGDGHVFLGKQKKTCSALVWTRYDHENSHP